MLFTNMDPNPARTPGLVPPPPMSRQRRASTPVTQSYVCLGLPLYLPSFPSNSFSAPGSHIRIRFLQWFTSLHTISLRVGSNPIYFAGEEYSDTVTLGPGLEIAKQSIGVAATVSSMTALSVMAINGLSPVKWIQRSRRDPRVRPSIGLSLKFSLH